MDAEKQNSGTQELRFQKLSNPVIDVPVCPVGHQILISTNTRKTITFLKWIIFEQYETFCNHCQRRYKVTRYRFINKKNWTIWQYKVWLGTDESCTVTPPPVEVLEQLNTAI